MISFTSESSSTDCSNRTQVGDTGAAAFYKREGVDEVPLV
jgi:hypothetical protein